MCIHFLFDTTSCWYENLFNRHTFQKIIICGLRFGNIQAYKSVEINLKTFDKGPKR